MRHFITIWLDLYLITSILISTPQHSINSKISMQKNLWFLKIKLFRSILIKSLQYLKHYPREKIIPHKQVLWYFIILHIPEAVKEKLLPTSLLLNRQLQVHLQNTITPLHPQIKQQKKIFQEKKTTTKKPHPQTFKIVQQKKEKKNNLLRICITSLPCMLWHSTNMSPGKTT